MGGSTRSFEMAKRLVLAGHEVHIITSYRETDRESEDWFVTNEMGINVHWLSIPYNNNMSHKSRMKAFFRFAYKSTNKAKSLGGDIVFATSTPLTIAIPAVIAARHGNIPMVFEVRDLWPEIPIAIGALKNPIAKWLAYKLEHWAYKNSESIVALSPGMKDGIIKSGYPANKIAVIPNCSDNSEFKHNERSAAEYRAKRPWLHDKPLVVYAGTFGKINGVGYMVDLAKELLSLNPEIRILLVGDGLERPLIEKKAEEVGVLGVNLFIEKQIAKKDMPALLSAADLSCNLVIDKPEMQSNSANKFFDTLSSGTPVLINHGGWMDELVKKTGCGLSVWNLSISQASKVINEKINNKFWMDKAKQAAKKLAEEKFDRDLLANQLEQILLLAVKKNGHLSELIAPGIYND